MLDAGEEEEEEEIDLLSTLSSLSPYTIPLKRLFLLLCLLLFPLDILK